MTAYQSILQALFARERDPDRAGRLINVSLFHSTADWMNVPYLQHRYGHFTPANHGLKHPSIAPYGAFTCSDGKAVLISIQNEREWQALCEQVFQNAGLATDSRFQDNAARVAHRQALDELVGQYFIGFTRDHMIKLLDDARIAFGRLSDLDDLQHHPQNRYRKIETPAGVVEALGRGAVTSSDVPVTLKLAALGEHNHPLRVEFHKPQED